MLLQRLRAKIVENEEHVRDVWKQVTAQKVGSLLSSFLLSVFMAQVNKLCEVACNKAWLLFNILTFACFDFHQCQSD